MGSPERQIMAAKPASIMLQAQVSAVPPWAAPPSISNVIAKSLLSGFAFDSYDRWTVATGGHLKAKGKFYARTFPLVPGARLAGVRARDSHDPHRRRWHRLGGPQ